MGAKKSDIWDREVPLDPGDFVLAVAPSGSGKTTLLRCILGWISPDSGRVLLHGQPVPGVGDPAWANLRASLLSAVLQDPLLIPGLTAAENLRLNPGGVSRARELAETLGLGHRLDAPVERRSTGQRQRVALCRALARPFSLLLLDEPFSHLDGPTAALAAECIESAVARNGAAVLCTGLSPHSPLAADRILHL